MKFYNSTISNTPLQLDLRHIWEDRGVTINNQIVVPLGVDLCEYYPNVEWDIINVTARRMEKFYPCCLEPWPDIMFNITIRRRTLFYTINLIMPCVAISALTILVFYLPSDSGEKITLSISIVLALTVFFLLLSDINPPTSIVIPLIGKYLLFTMVVVTMSIFTTVYTLSVHFRSPATHEMSPWVKRVFTEILPRILCMQRPGLKKRGKRKIKSVNGRDFLNATDHETVELTQNYQERPRYEHLRKRGTSETADNLSKYPAEIRESLKGVKYIAEQLKKEDQEMSVCISKHISNSQ